MNFSFIIRGNQDKPDGNAIPYTRIVKGHWRSDATRYKKWQEYVVQSFYLALKEDQDTLKEFLKTVKSEFSAQPICLPDGATAEMNIHIYWKNEAHADADNIFKGIADALFANDKQLRNGSFTSETAADKKGRVEVQIEIEL